MPELSEFIKERAKTLAVLSYHEKGSANQTWFTAQAEKAMWDAVSIAQKQTVAQSEDKE